MFGLVAGVAAGAVIGGAVAPAVQAADCSLGQQRIQGRGASFLNQAFTNTTHGWTMNAGCVIKDYPYSTSDDPADQDDQVAAWWGRGAGFLTSWWRTSRDGSTTYWETDYDNNDLVFFDSQGSTNGLAAFGSGTGEWPFSGASGARDLDVAFAASATGYSRDVGSPLEVAQEGSLRSAYPPPPDYPQYYPDDEDDGVLHTIPVAQSAIVIIIKRPLGCKLPQSKVYGKYPRFKLPAGVAGATNSSLEKLFAGEDPSPGGTTPPHATWGDLGWVASGTQDEPCEMPVRRFVVREDDSGTVTQFKRFLNTTDEGNTTPWELHDDIGENNRLWPGRTVADAFIDNDGVCDGNDPDWAGTQSEGNFVCADGPSGYGGVTGLANAFNAPANGARGGIGFADLSTARSKGFDWLNTADRTVWVPLYSPTSTSTVYDAQEAGPGFKTNHGGGPLPASLKGANCVLAQYGNNGTGPLPANTREDWSQVVANPTVDSYPLCGLGYIIAWEDYNDPYPNTVLWCPEKSGRQTAVKNYLEYVLGTTPGGDEGQTILAANDYSALPGSVLLKAQTYFTKAWFKKPPNYHTC